jgi:hypothetical protein
LHSCDRSKTTAVGAVQDAAVEADLKISLPGPGPSAHTKPSQANRDLPYLRLGLWLARLEPGCRS